MYQVQASGINDCGPSCTSTNSHSSPNYPTSHLMNVFLFLPPSVLVSTSVTATTMFGLLCARRNGAFDHCYTSFLLSSPLLSKLFGFLIPDLMIRGLSTRLLSCRSYALGACSSLTKSEESSLLTSQRATSRFGIGFGSGVYSVPLMLIYHWSGCELVYYHLSVHAELYL